MTKELKQKEDRFNEAVWNGIYLRNVDSTWSSTDANADKCDDYI